MVCDDRCRIIPTEQDAGVMKPGMKNRVKANGDQASNEQKDSLIGFDRLFLTMKNIIR